MSWKDVIKQFRPKNIGPFAGRTLGEERSYGGKTKEELLKDKIEKLNNDLEELYMYVTKDFWGEMRTVLSKPFSRSWSYEANGIMEPADYERAMDKIDELIKKIEEIKGN